MAGPLYDDPSGGLPPAFVPDLASLQYPWSTPPPAVTTPAAPAPAIIGPPPAPEPGAAPPYTAPEQATPPARPGPARVADIAGLTIGMDAPPQVAPPPPPPPVPGELAPGTAGPPLPPEELHYRRSVAAAGAQPIDEAGNVKFADDAEAQRYFSELAQRDPAKFAELQVQQQDIRDQKIRAEQQRIADEDWRQQQANVAMHQRAMDDARAHAAQLEADAVRLASTQEDPTGGLSSGEKIAGVLGAIVGGLVQGRTGSPTNAGLDALNNVINRRIAVQRSNLAHQRDLLGFRRGMLADEQQRIGDDFHMSELVRLATLKHADDLLARQQIDLDRRGTTFLRIASLRAGIAGQQQAALQAYQQKRFENSLKVQDAARQQQLADETARNNRAQIGVRYAEIAEQAAQRKEARLQREADKAAERVDKEAERDRQFAIGGTSHLQVGPDGRPIVGPDGRPVISYDDLRNADGTRWRAASPEETAKLREKKTAATQLTKLYDRVLAIRDRVGGESSWGNSDDYQELKALGKEILLLKKQGTQGMSSDADMENLAAAASAEDVTSFRSKAAGLKAARARTVDKLNQEFRDARYTGPPLAFPEPEPAKNTAAEDVTQKLLEKSKETFDDVLKREMDTRFTARGYPFQGLNYPEDNAIYQEALAAARKTYNPEASVEQRTAISALGTRALQGDAEAKQSLAKIAAAADAAAVRELAKHELQILETHNKPPARGPSSAPDLPPPPELIDPSLVPPPGMDR